MQKIDVIGGGFSGLIQAYYLVEQGFSVRLIEKQKRLGGLIRTTDVHGFVNESAANAILANKEIERIAEKISVRLYQSNKTSAKRFIYRDHKFHRMPLSVFGLVRPLIFLLKRSFRGGVPSCFADETLREWGERTLGVEATDYLLEPAMQGVFACGSKELNAELVLSSLFMKKERGLLKGSVAPKSGMEELINGLQSYLRGQNCEFVTDCEWKGAESSGPRVIAVGLSDLKELVSQNDWSLPLSLQSTRSASLTSVKLMFKSSSSMPLGFGGLFPRREEFNCLGVLFNHGIFLNRVPSSGESETWILNDEALPVSTMKHDNVLELVINDRARILKQKDDVSATQIDQWSHKIPIYDLELRNFIKDLEAHKTSDFFVGNYLGHLGLGKIIFRAQDNAKEIRRLIDV